MKKIILFFVIGFLLLFIIVFSYSILYQGRIVERSNYKVFNEKGNPIPAEVYKIKRGEPGLILVFRVKYLEDYSVLMLFPKDKIIGSPNGGNDGYIKINKKYGWQKKRMYNYFKIMFNGNTNSYNTVVFDDRGIKKIVFTNESVSFDAYGELKKYANRIIVKK